MGERSGPASPISFTLDEVGRPLEDGSASIPGGEDVRGGGYFGPTKVESNAPLFPNKAREGGGGITEANHYRLI